MATERFRKADGKEVTVTSESETSLHSVTFDDETSTVFNTVLELVGFLNTNGYRYVPESEESEASESKSEATETQN
jgi:hypothetical protein